MFALIICALILAYAIYEAVTVTKFIRAAKAIPATVELPFEMLGYAPIYNLPKVTVDLDPPPFTDSSPCSQPVRTDMPCQTFCGDQSAHELIVDSDTVAISSTVLSPGRYCTLSEPVPCSKVWGILVNTITDGVSGWECIAKQPDIVGGPAANIANISFLNSDTLLAGNSVMLDDKPLNFMDPSSLELINSRDRAQVVCNASVDGFNMVQLGNAFKCVKDPCQTIPGTDSHWNGTECVCGPNQVNINGPLTPCIGANYTQSGYDAATTTDYTTIECTSYSTPIAQLLPQPCPAPANQASTFGYSSIGRVAGRAIDMDRTSRTSGFVAKPSQFE